MAKVSSLSRDISPPPRRRSSILDAIRAPPEDAQTHHKEDAHTKHKSENDSGPKLAAIEAGQAHIDDHLEYFASHFRAVLRLANNPALGIDDFQILYKRNQHNHGRHYVVHQHDHPISGVHYDLRLQFSDSSTVSFAIPYGLPGNPNSVRPNRIAIETRVHTLWNNIIETASHSTGSLLIWDTGEYEILPWKENKTRMTDDELSDGRTSSSFAGLSQSERLFTSFRRRRIRVRLHGTHLPRNYTISMWLPSSNDRTEQPKKPKRKRRRIDPATTVKHETTSSSDNDSVSEPEPSETVQLDMNDEEEAGAASDNDEDATIRANNAYTGALNTIGSIHQRNWVLTLDKKNSGFRKVRSGPNRGRWAGNWEPFFVRGRDHERSVVTGRNADEVIEDEGVERFVGRKMWQPILK